MFQSEKNVIPKFADIAADVNSLSLSEMEEIKLIIEKVLIEKKREEILISGEEAIEEHKLKFYYSASDLIKTLNEPG